MWRSTPRFHVVLTAFFWLTASLNAGCSPPDESTPFIDAATAPPVSGTGCIAGEGPVPFLSTLGCVDDFDRLASDPLDATIPGARSLKTVIDRIDNGALAFQNTHQFPLHHDFATAHLSGRGLPIVPMLAQFNATEYTSPSRRFVLGTLTHYEAVDEWCYEIAPYDTADAAMIADAYAQIAAAVWFGDALCFHPTSEAIETVAAELPPWVRVVTSDILYGATPYQPLNVAEAYGRLRFAEDPDAYFSFRDIVVLPQVPNDISVVSGIITGTFQTPLSHINVLSKNRGTPNMALRGAMEDPGLRRLEGQWVRLRVGPLSYEIEAVTLAEADAWWAENQPPHLQVPGVDRETRALTNIEALVDPEAEDLRAAIKDATRTFGGKAAHYSVLANIDGVPSPKAFAIPVHYYFAFMAEHGFDARVDALLSDAGFLSDPAIREARLEALRDDMKVAPVDPVFRQAVLDKLVAEFPGVRMRFRSSTNAEDLDGFTGAGLYTSKSGDPDDPDRPVMDAIRKVWASVWFFRAFEERSYRGIDHQQVGMALLVHRSFPDEEINGVALTNNPFDQSGLEPAFYVNVQVGETSIVAPPPGVTADTLLYYFDRPDQPTTFISRSNLVPSGETVLEPAQLFSLGQALDRVRDTFAAAYGRPAWWAMDCEFKFDGAPGEPPTLFVKQARPYQ